MTKLSALTIMASLFAVTLSTDVCCKEDSIQKQNNKIFSLNIWLGGYTVEHCNPFPECELWPDSIIENNYQNKVAPSLSEKRPKQLGPKILARSLRSIKQH